MRQAVNRMIHFKGQCCVSIAMASHNTRPGNEKDPIQLKNLIKAATQMVYERFDKRLAQSVIDPLTGMANDIDHSTNREGLLLFANENFTETVKIGLPVTEKVVVDDHFMVRDLMYARQMEYRYYILVLGQEDARLLEAINRRLIKEYKEPFPLKNTRWHPENISEKEEGMKSVHLLNEYFNVVDKELNKIVQQNDYPVIIATEASNFPAYRSMADRPQNIAGHMPLSMLPSEASVVVQQTWDQVAAGIVKNMRVDELRRLEDARSAKNFLVDINEVYNAILEGRGRTLFVKSDYYPDLISENGTFVPVSRNTSINYRTHDAMDTLIREQIERSGEVVFIPQDADTNFNGMALITRY